MMFPFTFPQELREASGSRLLYGVEAALAFKTALPQSKKSEGATEDLNKAAKAASVLGCMEGNGRQSPGKGGHCHFESQKLVFSNLIL